MKVFSVKNGLHGQVILTGSTTPNSVGIALPLETEDEDAARLASGIAVSVLPLEYQRRLQSGEQISADEFGSLNFSVVE